jgi:hypothetical protein
MYNSLFPFQLARILGLTHAILANNLETRLDERRVSSRTAKQRLLTLVTLLLPFEKCHGRFAHLTAVLLVVGADVTDFGTGLEAWNFKVTVICSAL